VEVGAFSPETAQMVLAVIDELQRRGVIGKTGRKEPPPTIRGVNAVIALTPGGGIAARSGTTAGSANCTFYRVNSSGTLTTVKDNAGSDITATVYNIAGSAIAGSAYIQAKYIYGEWIADFEDCV